VRKGQEDNWEKCRFVRSCRRRGKTSNDGIYGGLVERRTVRQTGRPFVSVGRKMAGVREDGKWGRRGGRDGKLSCSLSQGTASDKMEGRQAARSRLRQISLRTDCSQLSSPLTGANGKKRHEIGSN
jgi:hypothetical protein